MHLPDWRSPKTMVLLPNPGYIEYQSFDGPFERTLEDLKLLFGDSIFSPTYVVEMESLALCGVPLVHEPRRYPKLLWECVNYTLPCRIGTEPICDGCMRKYDAARKMP